MRKFSIILFALLFFCGVAYAQQVIVVQENGERPQQDIIVPQNVEIDYNNPQTYIIGGVTCEGTNYLSPQQLISLSGLGQDSRLQSRAPIFPIS
ncbi:MAG: hypothetical protein J6Z27_02220 [Bacteroidales bacterium]|nr:hypothetical protein [Bacteroidales bacterium]